MYTSDYRNAYQFFALHALHQSLKEMDGIALAEVEGFLDGCDDVGLHTIRKTPVEGFQRNVVMVTMLKTTLQLKNTSNIGLIRVL